MNRAQRKIPELTNEDGCKIMKGISSNWEKIKGYVTKKGIMAKKNIEEMELQFSEAINTVNSAFEKYDCQNSIDNSK